MTANTETADTMAHTVDHATIVIDRRFDASPSQVFHAFADPAAKAHWFTGADDPEVWTDVEHELDFRVGGRETTSARPILTEQLAVLDGADSVASRQHGLGELLDALDAELKGARR
jgi:hypothetical protein